MKDSLIIILVIAVLVIGGILYFYRDTLFSASRKTSDAVGSAVDTIKEDVVDGAKDIKDTIK